MVGCGYIGGKGVPVYRYIRKVWYHFADAVYQKTNENTGISLYNSRPVFYG